MTNKEQTLSDKINELLKKHKTSKWFEKWLKEDVKEFIQETLKDFENMDLTRGHIKHRIVQRAGEELTGDKNE